MIAIEEFFLLKKKLHKNEELLFKIVSDSMEPLLGIGQDIKLVYTPIESLRMFDLIVFLGNERLVCHFFWHRTSVDGSILTRSLKNPRLNDFPIHPDFYLGQVRDFRLTYRQKAWVLLSNLFARTM